MDYERALTVHRLAKLEDELERLEVSHQFTLKQKKYTATVNVERQDIYQHVALRVWLRDL